MENYDPQVEELRPNTSSVMKVVEYPFYHWDDFCILSDRDLSMLGEARHRTVGGRGIVGQLVDQHKQAR